MGPPPKPKFNDNEKVLCYHGPLLYEAKCVKHKRNPDNKASAGSGDPKSEFLYWVHYQGWSKNWDEWVPENRILKINNENNDRKSKLLKDHIATNVSTKKKSGKSSKSGTPLGGGSGPGSNPTSPVSLTSSADGSKKSDSASTSRASTPVSERSLKVNKRLLADDELSTSSRDEETPTPSTSSCSRRKKTKQDEEEHTPVEELAKFQIEIPEELKYVLASDWDLVANKQKLFNLPAKTSAATILSEFVKYTEKAQKPKANIVVEVTKGIRDLFNHVVGRELLYSLERKQFEEAMESHSSKTPIEIFGGAHLLRMMVKINTLLNTTPICLKVDVLLIEGIIIDFLEYLGNNQGKYFTSKNYSDASEEYLKAMQE